MLMPNCRVKTGLVSVAWQPAGDISLNMKGSSESGEVTASESRELEGHRGPTAVPAGLILIASKGSDTQL